MLSKSYLGRDICGYHLQEHIADGTFGGVFKAQHPAIDHPVVVKVLLPHHLKNSEAMQRFEAEADMIARLSQHPNIVPMYDYWREDDGAYLVLKYLDGGTLRDLLRRRKFLTPDQTLFIFTRFANALQAAHNLGIIHRDLKASNVLFDKTGQVYLADFGIAKQQSKDITAKGAVLGTPAYLSPEQILGKPVTAQSDIYSLGILLYEMLAGERPFQGRQAIQVLMQHIRETTPILLLPDPVQHERVNKVIQNATAKDPSQRYQSVQDMIAALRDAIILRETA